MSRRRKWSHYKLLPFESFFFGIRNKILRNPAKGPLVVTPRLSNFGPYHIKFDLEFNVQIFERPCI